MTIRMTKEIVAAGGAACGFANFPTLGLKALKWGWNFDFQLIYVGAGAVPHYSQSPASLTSEAIILFANLWGIPPFDILHVVCA